MGLDDVVTPKRELFWIDVPKPFAVFGRGFLPGMHQAVGADVFVFKEIFPQVFGQFVKRCSGVCKVRVAAVSSRRELVGA
jgi:hypothetical protein